MSAPNDLSRRLRALAALTNLVHEHDAKILTAAADIVDRQFEEAEALDKRLAALRLPVQPTNPVESQRYA